MALATSPFPLQILNLIFLVPLGYEATANESLLNLARSCVACYAWPHVSSTSAMTDQHQMADP